MEWACQSARDFAHHRDRPGGESRVRKPRLAAIYAAYATGAYSYHEIAEYYGLHLATVGRLSEDGCYNAKIVPITLTLSLLVIRQAGATDTENPKGCSSKFKSNQDFGLIVFVAVVAGQVVV